MSPIQRSVVAAAVAAVCLLIGCSDGESPLPGGVSPARTANVPSDPNRFALLVGVDAYAVPKDMVGAVLPLKAPGNDVSLMKALLVEQYGFPDDPAHMSVLVGKQATRKAITDQFVTSLIEPARARGKDATVLFYFSGHGSTTADADRDEGDGVDETLVAYDSRAEGGRDIVDDEINAWLDELRKHTSNITLIFDSCHSGSAVRATAVGRKLPPNPEMPTPRAAAAGAREVTNAIVPRGTRYVLLSGSRANEQSHEDMIETPQGRKMYGFFTYYLTEALRASPSATYLEAVSAAEPAVLRHVSEQHPQAEGDVNRQVFGGVADRDDPYIRVTSKPQNKEVSLNAGQILGIRKGAIVAIYAPQARKLSGETHRLANAIVNKARVNDSVAELLEEPKGPITEQAKARVVTPYSGLGAMPVFIDELVDQSSSQSDRDVLSGLAKLLETNQLVTLARKSEPWSLGVKRGCPAPTDGCEEAYYLVSRNSDDPVTGAQPRATDDHESIVASLADGISKRAKQDNVRMIDNAVSSIGGQVAASLVAVSITQDEDGNPRLSGQSEMPPGTLTGVRVGEWYRIRVTNNSAQDLSVAVVALGTSGAINVSDITPTPTGERLSKHGGSWSTDPFRIGPPLGLETYKVIATTLTNVNFTTLQQPPPSRSPGTSAFEWLLNQTTNTQTRDPQGFGVLSADSWTTARVDLLVQSD